MADDLFDEDYPSFVSDQSDNDTSDELDDNSSVPNTSHDLEDISEKEDKFYFESHFHRNLTPQQIEHALEHAIGHGLIYFNSGHLTFFKRINL